MCQCHGGTPFGCAPAGRHALLASGAHLWPTHYMDKLFLTQVSSLREILSWVIEIFKAIKKPRFSNLLSNKLLVLINGERIACVTCSASLSWFHSFASELTQWNFHCSNGNSTVCGLKWQQAQTWLSSLFPQIPLKVNATKAIRSTNYARYRPGDTDGLRRKASLHTAHHTRYILQWASH